MVSRVARCAPISIAEFARVLPLSNPPSGWSDTLLVANSGGPDSTCLLFLLNRYLNEVKDYSRGNFPKRLISFTVDHELQPSSSEMANHAATVASSLGVEHITTKLPWGQHGLPQKPGPGEKIEGTARIMRNRVIFEQLQALKANAVAFGHHLDDRVETMLMRLGRGASTIGLAAIRPCRRWGMGNNLQDQYGLEGLSKWIIRPLLSFGKDRILETCKENKLSYVQDPTNFQPEITLRNAIRYKVCGNPTSPTNISDEKRFSPEVVQDLKSIQDAAKARRFNFSLDSSLDHLRQESNHISAMVWEWEGQVDEIIAKCRLPSPPGTFMISSADLDKVVCPDIKDLLLFRITRYVSPGLWGSPRAELGRRKSSVERLRLHISRSRNIGSSICVGSHVWWRPIPVRKHHGRAMNSVSPDEILWLAQRQPPSMESAKVAATFEIDSELLMWRHTREHTMSQLLFDRRFVIRIHPERVPQRIVNALSLGYKVVVEPTKDFFLPEIILRGESADELLHSHVTWALTWHKESRNRSEVISDWATVEYIRPISAI